MASSSKKVIYAALFGNTLIAVTKFVAAGVTGSAAMLAEGIHSVVDTGNQFLLLLGLHAAKRPPSEQFPFGHGKEVYFWSFVVAILVFALGAGLSFYKGLQHVLHPEPLSRVVVNYVVLGLAMLFEGGALRVAVREFRKYKGRLGYLEAIHQGKDPTMFVVLFEDSAAISGLVVAMLGIALFQATGNPIYDGMASMIIGLILGGTAIWLAYETKSLLIGESASPEIIRGIRDVVKAHPQAQAINEIATLHMGPEFIVVTLSLDFVGGISADGVEAAVTEISGRIKEIDPSIKRVFVEAEHSRDHARALAGLVASPTDRLPP
jgi:cation diffusion facilitator family transporter